MERIQNYFTIDLVSSIQPPKTLILFLRVTHLIVIRGRINVNTLCQVCDFQKSYQYDCATLS